MAKYVLTLYIRKHNCSSALAQVYTALSEVNYTEYELSVVDVDKQSALAHEKGITLTPALVYHAPTGPQVLTDLSSPAIRTQLGIAIDRTENVYRLNQKDEQERLTALRRYDILDTPPDGCFDRLTELASDVFGMPIVILSLVDTDRIWFKSHHGIPEVTEIGRDPGLCASAILSDDVYIIEDARRDPRCLTNPLVCGDFGLQFYAAAPLHTNDGFNLGTFCLIDTRKRYITRDQESWLRAFAAIAMDEMEIRLAARRAQAESSGNAKLTS